MASKRQQRNKDREDTRAYVAHLVERGIVRVTPDVYEEVIGKASDGVEVSLGAMLCMEGPREQPIDSLGSYLRKFPYPENW